MAIKSFTDLKVYKLLYKSCLISHKKILPKLPKEERFGLYDQISRASKAPLALLAEGYSRKEYVKEWKRYIYEAVGECNEMIVHLSLVKDLYEKRVDTKICEELIKIYTQGAKQLYTLAKNWKKYDK